MHIEWSLYTKTDKHTEGGVMGLNPAFRNAHAHVYVSNGTTLVWPTTSVTADGEIGSLVAPLRKAERQSPTNKVVL